MVCQIRDRLLCFTCALSLILAQLPDEAIFTRTILPLDKIEIQLSIFLLSSAVWFSVSLDLTFCKKILAKKSFVFHPSWSG